MRYKKLKASRNPAQNMQRNLIAMLEPSNLARPRVAEKGQESVCCGVCLGRVTESIMLGHAKASQCSSNITSAPSCLNTIACIRLASISRRCCLGGSTRKYKRLPVQKTALLNSKQHQLAPSWRMSVVACRNDQ